MNRRGFKYWRLGPRYQRGVATLLLTLVVLVSLTLVTFYSANTGLMKQRIAANEVRAREALESAEAGIERTIAFLSENKSKLGSAASGGWITPNTQRWVACTDADVAFPCGDGTTNRFGTGSMWLRYAVGGTNSIADISDYLADHPTPQPGDQPVDVFLAARCADEDEDSACDTPLRPSTKQDSAFLAIAQGWSADQTGTATVQQGLVLYQVPASAPDSPLTIKGNANIGGSFEVVANPNGGGPGVPLSVWSDTDIQMGASAYTCHLGEYLATPVQPSDITEVTYPDGETVQFCSSCRCSTADSTGVMSTNADGEQEDFVDVDGNSGVNPDADNFPSDLFEYAFGTPSSDWREIYDQAQVLSDCSTINASSSGLYWIEGDCSISNNTQAGSPLEPVLIVVDEGDLQLNGGATIYGLIFSFDNPDKAGSGGTVQYNGSNRVIGALIADHTVDLPNGNFTIRYEEKVLETLFEMTGGRGLGKRPGTWLDYVDYS